MSHRTNQLQSTTTSLTAAVATDVLFDDEGMDTQDADVLQVFLSNGGANPITSIQRREITLSHEDIDATEYGPLAAGDTLTLTFNDLAGDRTRLLLTSPLGTDVTVEAVARAMD